MIQANEIRVGNLIKSDGVIVTVDARTIFDICDSSKKYDPIPLTPDLLEKAGFKKDNIDKLDGYLLKGRLSIFLEQIQCNDGRIDWYTYIEHNVAMGFNDLVTSPPRYLHQLQNLFFCLTGEELKVNLPKAIVMKRTTDHDYSSDIIGSMLDKILFKSQASIDMKMMLNMALYMGLIIKKLIGMK